MYFLSLLSWTRRSLPVSSIEYWFRCMDLDGDGVLSMYELEFFYEDQCQKLETMAIEPLPFEDCLCQMLDLVKPEVEGQPRFTFIHTLRSSQSDGGGHTYTLPGHRLIDHEQL